MAIFSNRATLTYNGISTDSNVVTGEIIGALTVDKTAAGETYEAGGSITYAVSIVNGGTAPYTNLTVTDDLGAFSFGAQTRVPLDYIEGSALLFVNGEVAATPDVTAGPPLVVNGITVPAGGNAILIYRASVNGFAPLAEGSTVVNTVSVTGAGLSSPLTASETVTVEAGAALSITKSLSPETVSENGEITYTLVISNFGNEDVVATDNASVTDIFDPILSDITVTYNGTVWTEGTEYTYNEANGTFTTLPGQITVPAATYTQDPATGEWSVTPGTATLTVRGRI